MAVVPVVIESYVRDSWGNFRSAGMMDSGDIDLLAFFSRDDGTTPRYRIESIELNGDLVVVKRAIALSGVVMERSEILFPSEITAASFVQKLGIMIAAPQSPHVGGP